MKNQHVWYDVLNLEIWKNLETFLNFHRISNMVNYRFGVFYSKEPGDSERRLFWTHKTDCKAILEYF